MPNAKVGHLPAMQGVEIVPTRMAPRKRERSGWMSAPQLFLPNYVSHWSRGYALCLRQTLMEEWQKLQGFISCGVSPAEMLRESCSVCVDHRVGTADRCHRRAFVIRRRGLGDVTWAQ